MEEVPCRTSLAPLAFPCSVLCLIRVETEGLLDFKGRGRGSFPLYGGTFARSYSVPIHDPEDLEKLCAEKACVYFTKGNSKHDNHNESHIWMNI